MIFDDQFKLRRQIQQLSVMPIDAFDVSAQIDIENHRYGDELVLGYLFI